MLQSEFYERTKVVVDGEEYAKIEAVYNEVQMDKDDFCTEWKKIRNSKLLGEIEDAIARLTAHLVDKDITIQELQKQLRDQKSHYEEKIQKKSELWAGSMAEFAKKIIRANEDGDLRVYDVIEEEYSIGFIIKAKHEAGIPLTEQEISYMVSNL